MRRRCWRGWSRCGAARFTSSHRKIDRGRRVRLQPDRPSSLQANEGGKAAMVSAQVDEVKDLMAANIELMCAAD